MNEEIKYKRADKVDYLGGTMMVEVEGNWVERTFRPVNGTYVWAVNPHEIIQYVIQHPNGLPKSHFMAKWPFKDGFEAVFSHELDDDLLYVYAFDKDLRKSN